MDEIVEAMARAVCECDGLDWSAAGCDRAFYVNRARAALAVAAPMVLEMAAEAMESLCFFTDVSELIGMTKQEMSERTCREGARSIRSLKEQFNGNG